MKKLVLTCVFAGMLGYSTSALAIGGADVYRDGDTLVVKGPGFCWAMGMDNLKATIADKQWTPLKTVLTTGINSVRELTNKEREICFGDNAVPVYDWHVAAISSGSRPIYKSVRLASGTLERTKTNDRLASGTPCATDENNTYTHGYTGGKRMWRNVRGSTELIVYCAKK